MIRTRRFLGFNDNALHVAKPADDRRMKRQRTFDGRLGMKLGGKLHLEQHMLHHIAAELAREGKAIAVKQGIEKSPGFFRQGRGIAPFSAQRHKGMADAAAGGVPRRPTLARAGVGGVAIRAQGAAIQPGVRQGVDNLLAAFRPTCG